MRTRGGDHESDLVAIRGDGKTVAIEVTLSATVAERDVHHLHWRNEHIGDDVLDAIVLTTGADAYRRADGIGVVPLALLGPSRIGRAADEREGELHNDAKHARTSRI